MKKIISTLLLLTVLLSTLLLSGCSLIKVKENLKGNQINYSEIVGGWESSGTSGSYYVFNKDKTYYWYKSSEDLTDNYYKGEMTVLRGDDAITDLGISYEKVTDLFVNSKGSISLNNIYEIKLHPTYLISNGTDKTSNLTSNYDMKLLFVYIDENNAQAYNYKTQDTYYFTKK